MVTLLNKDKTIKKVILRNSDTYEEFLKLLKNENAPNIDFENFVNFMCNKFYINDDFFAILIIIKNNLDKFEGYDAENKVFCEILREIWEDYSKL